MKFNLLDRFMSNFLGPMMEKVPPRFFQRQFDEIQEGEVVLGTVPDDLRRMWAVADQLTEQSVRRVRGFRARMEIGGSHPTKEMLAQHEREIGIVVQQAKLIIALFTELVYVMLQDQDSSFDRTTIDGFVLRGDWQIVAVATEERGLDDDASRIIDPSSVRSGLVTPADTLLAALFTGPFAPR